MVLKKINLNNFRNFSKQKIIFNNKINIFIGKNGSGKTNILESIYFLSITKSHRGVEDKKLILKNEKFLKIEAKVEKQNKMFFFNFVKFVRKKSNC